ncbi:MAG: tyrosine-type recombinase/integrase [Chloroflexi bacterium]|nr:tyrosine-type recombinase/integrase [Chloroflexota bacterium]
MRVSSRRTTNSFCILRRCACCGQSVPRPEEYSEEALTIVGDRFSPLIASDRSRIHRPVLMRRHLKVAGTGRQPGMPCRQRDRIPSSSDARNAVARLHRTLDRLVGERPSRWAQADVIRLLLLTGCRKSEILTLRWSEVDGDMLRLAKAKTGPHTVWLSEAAQAVIARQSRTGSAFVFPSPRGPARPPSRNLGLWCRAQQKAGIEDVRLHDLQHTVAS